MDKETLQEARTLVREILEDFSPTELAVGSVALNAAMVDLIPDDAMLEAIYDLAENYNEALND
ncbi:hypothetical protein HOT82_gp142 [Gordonia phage Ronaldo]|uniref:Uncharacterized protein n=4 Tax=Ronaldovirus TaxID=2733205 RepID=A0A6B9L8C7_9CAUD|nr:hypothetical protein HOT81_gp139 [Gordonia phage Fryberger]YP_009807827.1 hypothetical protein HOT82_gp142 [Gordonia phage Ronaldo]QDH48471.1 hypothetical protein SEA_ZIKO_135 [Gordonia phage Ziko]QHB38247.1 hypothetical protein SEA_VOLT_136 [Gordonia phage Volt]AXN53544.1 hypothetical protein SEA_FRYBERGER_131 [Gordonia phage Fryberger]AXN53691.1 hypothetical protein SEA_RONALDO_133 [Gordonia phage Ronaldo]